jgi:hypothetical protein
MRILIDILIISLFCNGWYLITNGLLLDPLRKWYIDFAGGIEYANDEIHWQSYNNPMLKFFYKPLFGCVTCMASIPGSIVYWIIDNSLIHYPIVIIGAACTNLLINRLYDR